jgi:segregation and condensation protein A
MEYIDLMKELRLELAAEYLVMAAMLAEIKSRMLLPRQIEATEEEDPRAELIRRLQEYERIKQAAQDIDEIPRELRDTFPVDVLQAEYVQEQRLPDVNLKEMLQALQDVLRRVEMNAHHAIAREPLSIRERMSRILSTLSVDDFMPFSSFFDVGEGRSGVVVTFIAILELLKQRTIEIVQAQAFAPIYVKPAVTAQGDESDESEETKEHY